MISNRVVRRAAIAALAAACPPSAVSAAMAAPKPHGPPALPAAAPLTLPIPGRSSVFATPPAARFGLLTSPPLAPHVKPAARPATAPRAATPADSLTPGVTLDGTLNSGGPQTLQPDSTGTYTIDASMGRQVGQTNLFESFGEFSLATGQTANFTGPATVQNLLVRVTGGGSSIDGTLQCAIPHANLFLINPAGVTFGSGAALNIPGSVAVSTADAIGLADGGRFDATRPSASVLTAAAPASFAFSAGPPAGVSIASGTPGLVVGAGNVLSVVAGPIQLAGGTLDAPGGRVNLIAVGGPGSVTMNAADVNSAVDLGTAPGAAIVLAGSSVVRGDGAGGGLVFVRGSSLTLTGSSLYSQNSGATAGLGIDINVSGDVTISQGRIRSSSNGTGDGGPIRITSGGTLSIANAGTDNGILSTTSQSGRGGDIVCNVGALVVSANSAIDAQTDTNNSMTGPVGNITVVSQGDVTVTGNSQIEGIVRSSQPGCAILVRCQSLHTDDGGILSIGNLGSGSVGSLTVQATGLVSLQDATGNMSGSGMMAAANSNLGNSPGGGIAVTCAQLQIGPGGMISTTSNALSPGGDIAVTVNGPATIDGGGNTTLMTGVFANALATGSAGNINFSATNLVMKAGGQMSASTTSAGAGGAINVTVSDALTIDGTGTDPTVTPTTIISLAGGSPGQPGGPGGAIAIHAGTLNIHDGGQIAAATIGDGAGGSVTVNAGAILIDNDNGSPFTGITTSSQAAAPGMPAGSGAAGDVAVSCTSLTLRGDAVLISALTQGSGRGGSITVTATESFDADGMGVAVNGCGLVADSGAVGSDNSAVSGAGGSINLSARSITLAGGAVLTAAAYGPGSGGSVAVTAAGAMSLSDSSAVSSSTYAGGAGGSVTVHAGNLSLTTKSLITSDTAAITGMPPGTGNAGDVVVTADSLTADSASCISASTTGLGNAGNVSVTVGSAQLTGGTVLQATSTSSGSAGSVQLTATGPVALSSGAAIQTTAPQSSGGSVSVAATDLNVNAATLSSTGLKAGNVLVRANTVELTNGATLSTDTVNASPAGSDIGIFTASLSVLGSTISAQSTGPAAGGSIQVGAQTPGGAPPAVVVSGGSAVTASASGSGDAGGITVDASTLTLAGGSKLSSASTGTGNGGSVRLAATGAISIDNAAATVTSASADGGTLTLNAGGDVSITAGSSLVAQAARTAGGVSLTSPASVNITDGSVQAQTLGLSPASKGGRISIVGGRVQLSEAKVSAAASGQGAGGDVSVVADSLAADSACSISASTTGTGNAGDVKVTVTSAKIAGGTVLEATSTASGSAGSVVLTATGPVALSSGAVLRTTAEQSSGGSVEVAATDLNVNESVLSSTGRIAGTILVRASTTELTSGSTFSTDTVYAAPGGVSGIGILTDRLTVQSSQVSAQSTGPAAGGSVQIGPRTIGGKPPAVLLDGGSAITASASGSGDAGGIAVDASTLSLGGGSKLASASTGSGNGGSVRVDSTGPISIHGSAATVTAAASDGGSLVLNAGGDLTLSGGSSLVAQAARNAGGVSLTSPSLIAMTNASVLAQTQGVAAGSKGGQISIVGGRIQLSGTKVSAAASGLGAGGDVTLSGNSLTQAGSSSVSASSDSAAGGGITVRVKQGALFSDGASLSTTTPGAGGNISVSGSRIVIEQGASVSAAAGQDGNVTLDAPGGSILVRNSKITAQASGAGGGQIVLDPTFILLENSTINGLSANKPVKVKFDPSVTLLQSNSAIESRDVILPPTIDLTGSLAPLTGGLVRQVIQLQPQCGVRLGGANVSSFIVTGRGGEALAPGGFIPAADWSDDAGGSAGVRELGSRR